MSLDPTELGANLAYVLAAAVACGASVKRILDAWSARQAKEEAERQALKLTEEGERQAQARKQQSQERAQSRRTMRSAVRRAIRTELGGLNSRLERLEHTVDRLLMRKAQPEKRRKHTP